MAEGAELPPEKLPPLDGALALLKQYAAPSGGLVDFTCCGKLAGGAACPGA